MCGGPVEPADQTSPYQYGWKPGPRGPGASRVSGWVLRGSRVLAQIRDIIHERDLQLLRLLRQATCELEACVAHASLESTQRSALEPRSYVPLPPGWRRTMVNAGRGRGRRRRLRRCATAERAPVRRSLRTWELERPAPGATSSSGRWMWGSCWGPTRASEHFDLTSSAPSSSWSNPGPWPERQRLAASARCWRGPSTNAC